MHILKSLAGKPLSWRILAGTDKRYIFVYHDISEIDAAHYSELYSTRPGTFREQIEFFLKHFEFVPLEDLCNAQFSSPGRRLAGLTFDDGFLSVKNEAFPFLISKGVPFAVFVSQTAVTQNWLSNGPPGSAEIRRHTTKVYLDEEDLRYLSARGVLIGSHTSSHRNLAACSDDELREEIDANRDFISSVTGKPVNHLALPYGKREHYNERAIAHCFAAGHSHVYTSNPAFFIPGNEPGKRRLVPRVGLTNERPRDLVLLINRPLVRRIDI